MQAHITEVDGVLLQGNRLLIPTNERVDMLKRIHERHLGISKCREVARQSVWWPGLSMDINKMIEACYVCNKCKAIRKEPLKPTLWPEQPWHTVGTDLFEYGGRVIYW